MIRYYADFVTFPAATIIIALSDFGSWSWMWAALALFGIVLFTFVEYWTHRLILHRLLWHRTHECHHKHPSEKVVFPIWYLPLILTAIWFVLPTPVFVGFMVGVIWFVCWHHVLHHWDLSNRPWLARYELWHNLHHRDLPVNYGITHIGWDVVFRTYMSPANARWGKSGPVK